MTVILDDGERLVALPRDAATAARVVRIDGSADLWRYAHPLSALTEISGSADLWNYKHELPALSQVGGGAYLCGYEHELPALTTIGEWADLRGYAHRLPSLTQIGGCALLRGYEHIPAWIGYVGDDSRGYSFWADLLRHRVRAGCRNFTPEEALAHWGPRGESDRPDCLALAQQAIALIERSKEERT